ncbi:unnamed protein product [Adineta steineri]|uniref:Uncharacterized protein n=1 Tax=Adineta steineri TaxID=433720 RepID=A0A814U0W4_9BILA|nr:unnamed protein product [Adineta steineri]CAF1379614.1 unnamed protein product [Adineta steineri]
MSSNPEEEFLKLTQQNGKIDADTVTQLYDQLKSIEPSFLCKDGGEWEGGCFDTGHSGIEMLKKMNWAGETFKSENDVDTVMIYDQDGKRVWLKEYGNAQLREIKFRGKVSTAMVYDNYPIIDHFRYVNDNMVVGAMDNKLKPAEQHGTLYFFLTRGINSLKKNQ